MITPLSGGGRNLDKIHGFCAGEEIIGPPTIFMPGGTRNTKESKWRSHPGDKQGGERLERTE